MSSISMNGVSLQTCNKLLEESQLNYEKGEYDKVLENLNRILTFFDWKENNKISEDEFDFLDKLIKDK